MKMKTIESVATPDGKMCCEMVMWFNGGTNVYSVIVSKTDDGMTYDEIYRSYPEGKKKKVYVTYKKCCNQFLRNERRR